MQLMSSIESHAVWAMAHINAAGTPNQGAATGNQVTLSPNGSQLPGFTELQNITNGLGAFALVAALGSLVFGAAAWAVGAHSQNPRMAQSGKMAVMVSSLAGLLIGGSANIVNFFYGKGGLII